MATGPHFSMSSLSLSPSTLISESTWLCQGPAWREGRWPVHSGFHTRLCSRNTVSVFIKAMFGLLLTLLFLSWSELMPEIGLLCIISLPQDLNKETESQALAQEKRYSSTVKYTASAVLLSGL